MEFLRTTLLAGLVSAMIFPLAAQDPCDEPQITSLEYASFTDTMLKVVVINELPSFFGYPHFSVHSSGGDMIASEQLNFFILPEGEVPRLLDLAPGVDPPTSPFSGTVVLDYFTSNGWQQCFFPISEIDLCPVADCIDLEVSLQVNGTDTVTSTFPWSVTDDQQESVASGMLEIEGNGQQQDDAIICLAPGEYTLHVDQNGSNGNSFWISLAQDVSDIGPQQEMESGGSVAIPFTYYAACTGSGTGIVIPAAPPPQLLINGRSLSLTNNEGQPLGEVVIFDSIGRPIRRIDTNSSSVTIDLNGIASGIHFIRSIDDIHSWPAQRFMIQ